MRIDLFHCHCVLFELTQAFSYKKWHDFLQVYPFLIMSVQDTNGHDNSLI